MPEYRFKSQDADGKQFSGKMNALDEADLQKKLRNNGQMLISATSAAKKVALKPLKKSELANFCTELGTMTQAGVPLVRLLEILAGNESITPYERYLSISGITPEGGAGYCIVYHDGKSVPGISAVDDLYVSCGGDIR